MPLTDIISANTLEDCLGVFGRRGAGKSNVRQVMFEHERDEGHRSILIDPKGDSWGIRLMPDGKTPSRASLQVPIFGGIHGNYHLDPDTGALIGKLLATHDLSCILDLSLMIQEDMRRFMLAFARTFLHNNRAPVTMFIDEADVLCPSIGGGQGGPTQLISAMNQLAKLGRQRGIVIVMLTQRPAGLNIGLRSQADTYIAMRVTAPLDRKTYKDIFDGASPEHAKLVLDNASKLAVGEAFVWNSTEDTVERVQFPMTTTFDSMRTPKHGEVIADIQLLPITDAAIAAALDGIRDPAEADSLAQGKCQQCQQLQAKVDELSAQVAQMRPVVEWTDSLLSRDPPVRAWFSELRDCSDALFKAFEQAPQSSESRSAEAEFAASPPPPATPKTSQSERAGGVSGRTPIVENHTGQPTSVDNEGVVVIGEPRGRAREVLEVLVALSKMGATDTISEKAWALSCRVDPRKSTWRGYKAELRGWFNQEGKECWPTKQAKELFPAIATPPPGRALVEFWARDIRPYGAALILRALSATWPNGRTRAELAEITKADADSSTFRGYLAPLNTYGLIDKTGSGSSQQYKLVAELMSDD